MSEGAVVVCLGGAGEMGVTLSRHLSTSLRVGRLVVADCDGKRAAEVAAALADDANCEVVGVRVDILDAPGLRRLLETVDFVANAAGPFFRLGVPALEAAIDCGVSYLDICDDPEPTHRMLELDSRARDSGVSAVIGMGASPGLSNLLARRAADRLDEVIDCYTVWPLDGASVGDAAAVAEGAAPKGNGPSAAVIHLMEQISGEISVVSGGELVHAPPLERVTLDFPGLGGGTAITVGHPEPLTLHQSLGISGRAANLMLVRRTTGAFLDSLRRDLDAGKLDLEAAAAELMAPAGRRSAMAMVKGFSGNPAGKLPAFFALLRGVRDGELRWVGCRATSLPPGMDRVTSIPAALAVDQLLVRSAPPGVHPPETVIAADALLETFLPHCPGVPASVDELAPITEARA